MSEKYPKKLIQKRQMIEFDFIGCLYKDITLVDDYRSIKNGEDIITEDGMFYYGLISAMRKEGYAVADEVSICTYLEDHDKLKDKFEELDGYNSIRDMTDLLQLGNLNTYYGNLVKNNLILGLYDRGFNVEKYFDKFKDMSAEDIYDFMEYQLADVGIGKIESVDPVNLSTGYEEFIEEWDKGKDVGFKIGLPMLNYQLLGVHKKNLLLHLAGIGIGKTTSAISWYVIPAVEEGHDICIIGNEQDESQWRQMILSTVIFNKLDRRVAGLDRHKMMKGDFTVDQKDAMREAEKWLEKQPGHITFIETQDYDASSIKKIIARQSKLHCEYYLVDTMKPMDDSAERAWAEFSEVAKTLFLAAKKYDVAVIATLQLSSEAMSRRYLDLTCIGKSRAVAETAGSVVMFRPLVKSEREKICAYKRDKENNNVKTEIKLDENKDYVMVFCPKNRYGNVSPQIIVERNMAFNSYRNVGWYECEYDQFRTK